MSVEQIPPQSPYEFSPPLKAWSTTSRSLKLRHFPTTDAEVTYFPRRLAIVLAITFFLIAFSLIAFIFVTFLLFALFLIACLLIAFFILYL